jgi:hypothetical protein
MDNFTKIKIENTSDFEVLIIKKGSIQNLEWCDPN